MTARESAVERLLKTETEKLGGLIYKWSSPAQRGVPDRIIVWPGAYVHFVEVKAEFGQVSPMQRRIRDQLKAQGCAVHVLYGESAVMLYIESARETLKAKLARQVA